MPPTLVILEGPHGVGKSTMLEEAARRGLRTVPERFVNHQPEGCAHGSPGHQAWWLASWLRGVSDALQEADRMGEALVFVDRCPITTMLYGSAVELHRLAGAALIVAGMMAPMHVFVLMPPEPANWERIQERLAGEPTRAELHEGDRAHLARIRTAYQELLTPLPPNHYILEDNSWDLAYAAIRRAVLQQQAGQPVAAGGAGSSSNGDHHVAGPAH